MISLIPWVGGKAWLIPTLQEIMPRSYKRFVDVFGGGGSITLNLPMRWRTERIYNDIGSNLTNFMRVVKNSRIALLLELGFIPFLSRDEFKVLCKFLALEPFTDEYMQEELDLVDRKLEPPDAAEIKELLLKYHRMGPVKRAAIFYRVRRGSFSGMGDAFAAKAVNIRTFFYQIWRASDRLTRVIVENLDFSDAVRFYDGENTVFFMDPPYYEAEDMYSSIFSMENHLLLAQIFKHMKGFGIMTYNDCKFIRDLYEDFYIMHIDRPDSLSKKEGKRYEELIITNYDPREAAAQMSFFAQIPEKCTLINIPKNLTYIKQWR